MNNATDPTTRQNFKGNNFTLPSSIYYQFVGAATLEKPVRDEDFVFILFESGDGIHTINDIDHEIKPRQVHITFPGQVRSWSCGPDTIGYRLKIPAEVIETFPVQFQFSLTRYKHCPVINLDPVIFKEIRSELMLIEGIQADGIDCCEILYARLRMVALLINKQMALLHKDMLMYDSNPLLVKLQSLIDTHFAQQRSVAFYARQLNVSPGYLGILCKKGLQVSPIQLIQQRIILEAKRLIRSSNKSIKEIAFELGFGDLAYFSRFFKSNTGFAPRHFKQHDK
ncbi:helix-turn-helix domain-containing protein [Chitinophaga vietnamensis]|uniref:helix-turn-helix domain-containing protein n=1 Tax=Chitinophaga vietnamensis TaxID=2593957 RepID=UPI001177F254|nr:AraC family transcriptional regulator [Chitinophaga vietnamensis]